MAATGDSYPAKIEKTQYHGWNVFRLTNGIISLDVAPDLGGRAIQLRLREHEYFFVNKDLAGKVLPPERNNVKAGWANYGGDKVWPGAQGWLDDDQWPGPPDYILDGSRFASEVITESPEEVAVRVTSPPDPRTGVRFARTFHVCAGTTRVKVEQVMRNISRRQIHWGIWHLIQNDGADARDPSKPNPELYMYIPLNPKSKFPGGFQMLFGDAQNPSYQATEDGKMLRIHYHYRVGKVIADSDKGWYAVVNGQKNICLVENFTYYPSADYPDGASVESWNDGPGTASLGPFDMVLPDDPEKTLYFMESEVMSPYATLLPGEEYSFPCYWAACRAPNPIREAVWAGAISEPLAGKVEGTLVMLKGVFGVFTPGTAEATFYSVQGEELNHETLQAVDPREVFRLEQSLAIPPGAFRVSVLVRDTDGENRGFLGNVILDPNYLRRGLH